MPEIASPARVKPPADNKDLTGMISKTTVLSSEEEKRMQINPNSATVTLSGGDIPPAAQDDKTSADQVLSEDPNEEAKQTLVPELSMAEITTAGKGDEMLNILVNDSFSTNKSGKKKGKKGKKGKQMAKMVAEKMGFSAMEIL